MTKYTVYLVALLMALTQSASAATFRYEFDITGSVIDFHTLIKIVPDPNAPSTPTPDEYAAFVAAYHYLGDIVGQTGHVVLEVVKPPREVGVVNCISGFICPAMNSGQDIYNDGASGTASGFASGGALSWSGYWNYNLLTTFNDSQIGGRGILDGVTYLWWVPQGRFNVSNLVATDLSNIPLPASFPALLAGLAGFGWIAKRRRRT